MACVAPKRDTSAPDATCASWLGRNHCHSRAQGEGHPRWRVLFCGLSLVHISNFTLHVGNAHAAARLLAARLYFSRGAALLVALPRPLRKSWRYASPQVAAPALSAVATQNLPMVAWFFLQLWSLIISFFAADGLLRGPVPGAGSKPGRSGCSERWCTLRGAPCPTIYENGTVMMQLYATSFNFMQLYSTLCNLIQAQLVLRTVATWAASA